MSEGKKKSWKNNFHSCLLGFRVGSGSLGVGRSSTPSFKMPKPIRCPYMFDPLLSTAYRNWTDIREQGLSIEETFFHD